MSKTDDNLWGFKQIAKEMKVHPATISRWYRSGLLPPPNVRLVKAGRWLPEVIQAWREAGGARAVADGRLDATTLQVTMPPEPEPTGPKVYLVRAESGQHKIGWSIDPAARLLTLQTSSPCRLRLVLEIETDYGPKLEGRLHQRFASKRLWGEWFSLSAEDVQWLEKLAALGTVPHDAQLPE